MNVRQRRDEEPAKGISADGFDRMLYHITHDLRALFRALRVIPDWIDEDLQAGAAPSVIAEHVDMLRVQARRCDRMLGDLAEFGRVGRTGPPLHSIDPAAVAREVWDMLGVPPDFALEIAPPLPSVRASPDDLERLLRAVLANAVHHHDRSSGLVVMSATAADGMVTLRITDDGPGIPAALRPRAIALMSTLRPRDEREGSGVGLALAAKAAQSSGGWLRIEDPPRSAARGVTIAVTLPAG